MKRYLGIIVAIVFVIVAIVLVSKKYNAKALEADRAAAEARIHVAFYERVGWLRANPDEKSYKDEVTTFFHWYFAQVNEYLNTYGGNRNFDDYLLELEAREGRSSSGDDKIAEKKAVYEYTRKIFDQMKGGNYAPVWTATDKGMRLDILSTSEANGPDGRKIRYQVVLWGPSRQLREDNKVRKMQTSASWNITWKLTDEKGKLIGEMNAAGDPAMKVDWPERYVPWFPAQMLIGHYDVDLLPGTTKTVDITFAVSSHSPTGGEALASFNWKLDAPAEWKLREGEEWKGATESVRPEEEIDPAMAAKKGQAKR
jgi:hypothetical protein